MKILLASGAPVDFRTNTDRKGSCSTGQVYAINLAREFMAQGIEVASTGIPAAIPEHQRSGPLSDKRRQAYDEMNLDIYDHAICTEQNGFARREPYFHDLIRSHTKGAVCTIADHDRESGPEDFVFHARRSSGPSHKKAIWVGWAADDNLFYPEKDDDCLTVFVDHKYYTRPDYDWTERMLTESTRFAAAYESGEFEFVDNKKNCRVLFLGPTGIEETRPPEIRVEDLGNNRREFMRRVPHTELAEVYRCADIYLLTHSESMGLSTLEAAMAGCLIVSPYRFMQRDLLYPLNFLEFPRSPDWTQILAQINPDYSRNLARQFTWKKLAERVLSALESGSPACVGPARTEVQGDEWIGYGIKLAETGTAGLLFRVSPERGAKKLARNISKPPWPQLVSARFKLNVAGCNEFAIRFLSNKRLSRDEYRVIVNPEEKRCTHEYSRGEFRRLGTGLKALGDDWLECTAMCMTNDAPILTCEISLEDGRPVTKNADCLIRIAESEITIWDEEPLQSALFPDPASRVR